MTHCMQCSLHIEQLADLLLRQVADLFAGCLAFLDSIGQQLVSVRNLGVLELQLCHLVSKLMVLNLREAQAPATVKSHCSV